MSDVEIDLELIRKSPAAYLVSDGEIEEWLPKSQVEVDSNDDLEEGQTYLFIIPEWLAFNKGFV